MRPDDATVRMRQMAANLDIQRARLSGILRTIRDLAGIDVVRAMTAAEIERLTLSANDNGSWIG